MIFFTNLRIAIDALRANKTRTYLTMLGVFIGVAAITYILVLGDSFKHAITNQVKELGNNLIIVRPGSDSKGIFNEKGLINYNPLASYATTTITEQDVKNLAELPAVDKVAPFMLVNGVARSKEKTSDAVSILATSPDYADILKLKMTDGQFIDPTTNRDTVVVGKQLAIDLYGTDHPIGETLKIRGRDHTIIGILRITEGPIGINGVDLNNAAIVSLDDGKSFNQGVAQIQQLAIVPSKKTTAASAKKAVYETLKKNHSGEVDFTILAGQDASVVSRKFYEFVTALTAVVASVAIIVGGVGIMNIMLVGVAERTREVGIRKSVGASNTHILWQFLIEALIMSITGGIFGALFGAAAASATTLLFGLIPSVSWLTALIAVTISIGVGVIFGLVPSLRAARKDPIEALRDHN